MNMILNAKKLPFLAAGLGLLALILRAGLFLLGRDEKNLLIAGHPLALLTWAVTAAAVVLILLSVRKLDGSPRYANNFSASASAAVGTFALAGGIAVSVLLGRSTGLRLDFARDLLGLLAVPSIVWVGICRYRGKRPSFLFHAIPCLFLTLYTISHYQHWSSCPQIQDWFYSMSGIICLALFAYYQTSFDVGLGRRRMQLITGLLAGFFCIAAVANGVDVLLYIGGAVWALTNLCSLTPTPRRRKNPAAITEKDAPNETA